MATWRLDTPTKILDTAEELAQVRGFNGFSYGDVAERVGLTTAALHYHFPSKAELGVALMARYAERFAAALAAAEARLDDEHELLTAYGGLYAGVLRGERMCLCGMLAAEYDTLPEPLRGAVLRFFDDSETWLEAVLERGRLRGKLAFEGPAREAARLIVSGLEGAMLVARPYRDPERYQAAARRLLAAFEI